MTSVTSTPMMNRQSSVLFDSMTQLVPPGHEKPLKQAFYTAAAILFVAVSCAAAVSVYFVLQVFIKPLLWALLCGSFLFPFKHSLNSILGSWLKAHEESGRPLIVGAVLIPISLFDGFAEKMGNFVMDKWKVIVAVLTTMTIVYILYLVQLLSVFYLIFFALFQTVVFLWNSTSIILELCVKYRIVMITLVGAYFIIALMFEPRSFPFLEYASVPAWILLLVCLVSVAGSLKVPCGIALIILMITGVISAKKQKGGRLTRSILRRTSSITALLSPSSVKCKNEEVDTSAVEDVSEESVSDDGGKTGNSDEDLKEENDTIDGEVTAETVASDSSQSEVKKTSDVLLPANPPASAGSIRGLKRHRRVRDLAQKSSSTIYFNLLFIAFALVMIWHNVWLITLLVIPFLYWCCKRLLYHDMVCGFLEKQSTAFLGHDLKTMRSRSATFIQSRKSVLIPASVRGMAELVLKGDRKFNSAALLILPTMTSIIMILILIVGSVFISVFFAVKIQQESFLMVQMTSDMINETVSNHPEYQAWLPDNDTMQKSMDSIVDNVYLQGREWIKTQVQENIGEDANVSLVEKQALKIWDRAYHSWFNKTEVNERKFMRRQTSMDLNSTQDGSGGLFSGVMDLLNMSEVIELLKENMSALMSVMESVWSVLQSNVSLIFSSITTVLTILLNGGTAILNFVLSTVIFFTALFYLLAGSEKQYMPVQWIGFGVKTSSSKPSPIASSIQDAISGVFGASLKMASFYGLYTWLNHTTFGAILVYVPSVLAAIFSVVPVFTTYWACIPAFFEIWLLQGDLLRALALLFFQFLPTMFVDGAIYSEMAESGGGHPYVTGLAVAGGLYYFGLEGAIIGPILLCILLVAVNVYSQIINMPATPAHTPAARPRPLGQLFKRTKSSESRSESFLPKN